MRRRKRLMGVVAIGGLALATTGILVARSRGGAAVDESASASLGARAAPGAGVSGGTAPLSPPLALPKAAAANNAIPLVRVKETRLAGDIQLTGNVSYDADHFAIVGPLVAGRVSRINVGAGARVRRGEVLAELESVDLGQARGDLISAKARLGAAESNLRRERELAEKKISSSREREVAEAQYATERAAVRAAHERLRAIGLTDGDIAAVEEHGTAGRIRIRSPIDGTVMERFVTLGEATQSAADAFKVADLRKVWVQLDLYEKDLARVRVGLAVEIRTDAYPGEVFSGRVAYVAPIIDEATRTAKLRVEIDNREGKLHIGQLVSAKLIGNAEAAAAEVLAIPRSAVQRIDGKTLVFTKVAGGFERQFVELGASGGDWVEVRRGLTLGQEIAAEGGFLLKSELLR